MPNSSYDTPGPRSEAPRNSLHWEPSRPPRDGVVEAFRQVIRYARGMTSVVFSEPETAVHEYRKSIRRLRALVKLIRGHSRGQVARTLDRELRDAVRPTSGLRDSHVLLATLRGLPVEASGMRTEAYLTQTFESECTEGAEAGREAHILLEVTPRLDGLTPRLEESLPADLTADDLVDAWCQSYRRARRSARRARGGSGDAIHSWRKRVKELRYQLELVRERAGPELITRQKAFARLAQALGDVTDLLVLEEALRDRRRALAPRKIGKLRRRIRRERQRRFEAILADEATVFEERPRDLARAIRTALPLHVSCENPPPEGDPAASTGS